MIKVGDKIVMSLDVKMNGMEVEVVQVGCDDLEQHWIVKDHEGSMIHFKSFAYMMQPSDLAKKNAEEKKVADDKIKAAQLAKAIAEKKKVAEDNANFLASKEGAKVVRMEQEAKDKN